jgi:hypothetical protein
VGLLDFLKGLFGFEAPSRGPSRTPGPPAPRGRPALQKARPPKRVHLDDPQFLQFPANRRRGRVVDLVVGFDLGTSSTKVVIRSPWVLDARATLVDFGSAAHPSSPFLLPTTLWLEADGGASLTALAGAVRIDDLKVRLMATVEHPSPAQRQEAAARVVAYLALALRHARWDFLSTNAKTYGFGRLRWRMNLGIPSAGYDDEAVRSAFGAVAQAGWRLSLSPEPVSLGRARSALATVAAEGVTDLGIELIPEVVAEVVGYARSRQRDYGLHLVVDCGASTLDVCSFVLHEREDEHCYELLTAVVEPMGLLSLHSDRMVAAQGMPPFHEWPADVVSPLPDWIGLGVASEGAARLRTCDEEFADKAARVLVRVLAHLRQRRDPYSQRWRDGLPAFLCGGGGASRLVKRAVELANAEGERIWDPFAGLAERSLALSLPGAGDLLPRLAVANGLSHHALSIGEIEPPSRIPDVTRKQRVVEWQSRFIDKDQV